MGDFNARTGTSPEFNVFDINHHTADQLGIDDGVINYLNNAHELNNHDIPQFRNSMDKVKNNFGNKLLELCKNNNIYVMDGSKTTAQAQLHAQGDQSSTILFQTYTALLC